REDMPAIQLPPAHAVRAAQRLDGGAEAHHRELGHDEEADTLGKRCGNAAEHGDDNRDARPSRPRVTGSIAHADTSTSRFWNIFAQTVMGAAGPVMRILIAAVGRLKAGPEKSLFDDYVKRLSWPLTLREVEARGRLSGAELKIREGEMLLAA